MDTGTPKDFIQVNFQNILGKLLSYWWLFALTLIVSISSGYFYLRYTTFEYSARAIFLIKDAGSSGNISEQSILLTDQLSGGGGKAMDNQIQILTSITLIEKVVEKLNLDVSYYRQGNFKESELYTASPFILDSFELFNNNQFGKTFFLELKDYESFIFKTNEDDDVGIKCYFGTPFETADGRFLISLSPVEPILAGEYRLTISPLLFSAFRYKSNLRIERIGDQFQSSVLELKILDPVPEKAKDILNTLMEVYDEEEIKDENQVFRNTLDFIDNRVASLVNELDSVEGGIQQYKSTNAIISESAAASMNYTLKEIRGAVQQLSTFEIQKNLLESLKRFLPETRGIYHLIPANLIEKTPVLSGLVNRYNDLVLSYDQMSNTASEKNPVRIELENQLFGVKNLIQETIINLQKEIEIPIKTIESNIRELKATMGSIPGIEKRLVEKIRTQTVKENLYLYLLQKREDTALSEAITTAKTRIIDKARTPFFPVYPKRKLVLVITIILGIFIPLLIILLKDLFETRIDSEETIKNLTSIPILGGIAYKKSSEEIIIEKSSRSTISEMFKLIRTNLDFVNQGKKQQTIMVTSSISGEGKTFIALNLGLTLALGNKKVLLIGLDLRKPKLGKYLKAASSIGITNYLIRQNEIDDIIQTYPEIPNLSYITSGAIPPNPAELIMSDRMKELLEELSNRYDYIIIDTPPVGMVADALLLRNFVDNIFVIVRNKLTPKGMLRNLEEMHQNGELKNASIIYNGLRLRSGYYGYGKYRYGYSNEYYVDE